MKGGGKQQPAVGQWLSACEVCGVIEQQRAGHVSLLDDMFLSYLLLTITAAVTARKEEEEVLVVSVSEDIPVEDCAQTLQNLQVNNYCILIVYINVRILQC